MNNLQIKNKEKLYNNTKFIGHDRTDDIVYVLNGINLVTKDKSFVSNTEKRLLQGLKFLLFLHQINFIEDLDYQLEPEKILLEMMYHDLFYDPSSIKDSFIKEYQDSKDIEFESTMNYQNIHKLRSAKIFNMTDGYYSVTVNKNSHKLDELRFSLSDGKKVLYAKMIKITSKNFINENNLYLLSLLFINMYLSEKNNTDMNEKYSFLFIEAKKIYKELT